MDSNSCHMFATQAALQTAQAQHGRGTQKHFMMPTAGQQLYDLAGIPSSTRTCSRNCHTALYCSRALGSRTADRGQRKLQRRCTACTAATPRASLPGMSASASTVTASKSCSRCVELQWLREFGGQTTFQGCMRQCCLGICECFVSFNFLESNPVNSPVSSWSESWPSRSTPHPMR